MRLFQNRALKKIFGPKKVVIKKNKENRVKVSLITLITYYCYSRDTVKDSVQYREKRKSL